MSGTPPTVAELQALFEQFMNAEASLLASTHEWAPKSRRKELLAEGLERFRNARKELRRLLDQAAGEHVCSAVCVHGRGGLPES